VIVKASSEISIVIPVHGWSEALQSTLERLSEETDPRVAGSPVVLSNSGPPLPPLNVGLSLRELPLPEDHYWGGAVRALYREAARREAEQIVLMNHDCSPRKGCLPKLLDFQKENPRSVVHAVLVSKGREDRVWWAGSKQRFARELRWTYAGEALSALPKRPFRTDSLMGQCLVLPKEAARERFLPVDKLPHYFGDSVQACLMRRAGFQLFVHPEAVAVTDQGDLERKRERLRCVTPEGLRSALLAPYSWRNLKAVWHASLYHQDTLAGGIVLGGYLVTGKLIKSLLERFGVIRSF